MTKDETIIAQQARIEQLRRVVGKVSGTVDAALSPQHAIWKREIDASLVPMDNLSALRAHDAALTAKHIEICEKLAAENEGLAGEVWCERCAYAIKKGGVL